MKIEYEGVVIELTQEQIDSIERQKNKKSPEALFKELVLDRININSPKVDFEKYENRIYWFDKNEKYISHYNWEYGEFWFDHDTIWSVFCEKFDWNYEQTQEFMKTKVKEYFKLKGYKQLKNI